jgi:hypothetical protein
MRQSSYEVLTRVTYKPRAELCAALVEIGLAFNLKVNSHFGKPIPKPQPYTVIPPIAGVIQVVRPN